MPDLVIVESPTKARTLSRFLGSEYKIEATMGHMRDLPQKKLGIKIEEKEGSDKNLSYDFVPDYQTISDRRERVGELFKLAQKAKSVILATDPDREGEAIAYHLKAILEKKLKKSAKLEFSRIVFHEITQSAIKEAITHPRKLDMMLVDAQQARRILDRLVGYKLSPLLWNKLGKRWLSAGRVQTVAVRLIVDREKEIKAFVPVEYWHIDVKLEKMESKESFISRLAQIDGEKADIKDKTFALSAVENLKKAKYTVAGVETKEVRRYPAPPFTTSTLSQTASNKLGWSARKTMRTAQGLYEEGYISYHRTDSTNLSKEAITMARDYINGFFENAYLPPAPKFYKTKSKVAQEAHEAIRPTRIKLLSKKDADMLNPKKQSEVKVLTEEHGRDAQLLYSLIWRRFLSCQMNEAVFDQTTASISAKREEETTSYLFRTTGTKMKFPGWITLYDGGAAGGNNQAEGKEENYLPGLAEGEILKFCDIMPQQKFTEPPPRFTEASLIKALEEQGIGRPSTYAPIISTIEDRKYVEKIEKKFHPTDLGTEVADFLVKYFPDIFAVSFTAKMEDDLDEIANGALNWIAVLSDFYSPLKLKLDKVFKEADRVMMNLGMTEEKCAKCKSDMVVKMSRYGKFLACGKYPACTYTKSIVENAGIKCPKCGAEMAVKKTRRGKQFYGCSGYPKCKFAAWKKEDIK